MESIRGLKLPEIKRKCLVERFPLKSLRRNISFEVADVQDRPVIERLFTEDFNKNEVLCVALKMTNDELIKLVGICLDEFLSRGLSVLAIDDGHLCGMFINSIVDVEHKDGKWKEPKMKEDYGKEFDESTEGIMKYRKVKVTNDVFSEFLPQFVTPDVKEVFFLDMLNVHKSYVNNGIATKLTIESCKLAHQLGFKWAQISVSALGSIRIVKKLGFTQILKIDLPKFRAHGKSIIADKFHDGGEEVSSHVIELAPFV